MKKNYLLLFLFLSTGVFAQVAGYMGKRFSIGYSNYFSPRLPILSTVMELRSTDYGALATKRSFNTTHCIDADYILGSSVSLCLSGQFSKMDLCKYGSQFYVEENPSSSYNSFSISYLPSDGKDMQLKTINFSAGFKFFKERYLNPYGKYRKVEFILVTDKVLMDKDGFYYDSGNGYNNIATPYTLPDKPYKFKSLAFAYTIGKQRILFNNLVLDYGFRIGFNCSYIASDMNVIGEIISLSKGSDENESVEATLKKAANIRLFQSQILNVHIGLRFLTF